MNKQHITLNPEHKPYVVAGVEKFVAGIDLGKYALLKPNDGRVIVKIYNDKPEENSSAGGIILSGETKDKQAVGIVVAAGKGMFNAYSSTHLDLGYEVGDLIFFPEHFGHEFFVGTEREKLLSIMSTDIIAKLTC